MLALMPSRANQLDQTLGRLWRLLAALVTLIAGHALSGDPHHTGTALPRWVRPSLLAAEALARRLLMVEARQLQADGLTLRPRSPSQASATKTGAARSSAPRGFALFEPIASLAACIRIEGAPKGRFGPAKAPRIIDIFGDIRPDFAAEQTERTPSWLRRLSALERLLDTREAAALRLARRLAAPIATSRTRRRSPLRPGLPPGANSRLIPDWLREGLRVLAFELRGQPPPPSAIASPA